MGDWIKCSEQMPEKGQSVLASGTWFEYAVIAWDGKKWLDLDYEEPVIHWQPLPSPPEDV